MVYLFLKKKVDKTIDGTIKESDINEILRSYDGQLPDEARLLLQALRSAVTDQKLKNALNDADISIHLNKSRVDYKIWQWKK